MSHDRDTENAATLDKHIEDKGDCGIRAISAVTGSSFGEVEDMFVRLFGKTHIRGRDMRQLLTANGWTWTHAYGIPIEAVPTVGKVVVVTRRGFYAVIDGEPHEAFPAPICGYYQEPSRPPAGRACSVRSKDREPAHN